VLVQAVSRAPAFQGHRHAALASPLQTFVSKIQASFSSFSFSLTFIGMVADDHLLTSFPRRVQHGGVPDKRFA
jgi:hypothetical protein